jgi:hypothetical protein
MPGRYTAEYWRDRADELRLMSQLFPTQRTKDVLIEVAHTFYELANLPPKDLARIIKTWDANRRSDAIEMLLEAPFFKHQKESDDDRHR